MVVSVDVDDVAVPVAVGETDMTTVVDNGCRTIVAERRVEDRGGRSIAGGGNDTEARFDAVVRGWSLTVGIKYCREAERIAISAICDRPSGKAVNCLFAVMNSNVRRQTDSSNVCSA